LVDRLSARERKGRERQAPKKFRVGMELWTGKRNLEAGHIFRENSPIEEVRMGKIDGPIKNKKKTIGG